MNQSITSEDEAETARKLINQDEIELDIKSESGADDTADVKISGVNRF